MMRILLSIIRNADLRKNNIQFSIKPNRDELFRHV